MLSYIKLKNFKSFSDITFDLRGKNGTPKKIAFIYGENGSGKSNLMYSMLFLSQTFNTLKNQEIIKDFKDTKVNDILSANNDFLKKMLISRLSPIEDLINNYKSINVKENLKIEIGFFIKGKNGTYTLEFNNKKVVFEELKYQISERIGTFFSISEEVIKMSPSIFIDNDYKRELQDNIDKYWGKHTFMGILFNEKESKNSKYVNSRLNENILDIIKWFERYSVSCENSHGKSAKVSIPYKFLQNLKSGVVKRKSNKELLAFEGVLNKFFSQLYSDIKGVYYKISEIEDAYKYELIVKKLLNGKITEIPFSIESTGTQKLLDIFPYLFTAIKGESVFVDEVDSGIHDVLMCNIIELLEESLEDEVEGQFIATTHNTLLMKNLSNDNIYILRANAKGYKEFSTLSEYDFRTQKANNVQSKYLKGDYAGIPYIGFLDLAELVDDVDGLLKIDEELTEGD